MSHVSIAVVHRGHTDDLYESCGNPRRVVAILEAVGVDRGGRNVDDFGEQNAGEDTTVSLVAADETDYDVWCAACGEFLHRGLSCEHAATEEGKPLDHPHIALRDAPSIRALWR